MNEGHDRFLAIMGVRRAGSCLLDVLDVLGFVGLLILARESASMEAAA